MLGEAAPIRPKAVTEANKLSRSDGREALKRR
jgi:hypothetical protein